MNMSITTFMREKEIMEKNDELTSNQLINVKNVKGIFLYTKDNLIISYLRIHFLNIDLLSKDEKKSKTRSLAVSFEGDKKDFAYISYPREIDLDTYKDELKRRRAQEISQLGRKKLLEEMLIQVNELANSGENYEHQHFIKLWKEVGHNTQDAESALRNRVEEFKTRYESIGIQVEILTEQEILKMCNLFSNSMQAPYTNYGSNMMYEYMTEVKE